MHYGSSRTENLNVLWGWNLEDMWRGLVGMQMQPCLYPDLFGQLHFPPTDLRIKEKHTRKINEEFPKNGTE